MIKILVVDDSPFVPALIREMIANEGFEIVGHAISAEEGINLYKDLKPDIVTMDIILPGIDGIDAAREILKSDPTAKIIMLSSLCDKETMEEIETMNIKSFVPKPLEKEVLLKALKEAAEEQ